MNLKTFVIFFLMAALVILGLGSCLSNKGPNDAHNSKNNVDWEGEYIGTVVSDSGVVLNVRLRLNRDQSFEYNCEYLDKSHDPINFRGPFQWDDAGSIIIIDVIDAPTQYKVVKDKLIRLDVYNYELKKAH